MCANELHPNEPAFVFRAPSGAILPTAAFREIVLSTVDRRQMTQPKREALGAQIKRQTEALALP